MFADTLIHAPNWLLKPLGLRLSRLPRKGATRPLTPYSETAPAFVDLPALEHMSETIPGMVPPKAGTYLYALCYFQGMEGNVAEIGSWQGRSSSFLGRAVQNSGNGRFFAIDHFKGNVGKEEHYVVGREDLSDLSGNFRANMERIGLSSTVELLDMPSVEAAPHIADHSLRFLFIDGDHTREGVERDLAHFLPKMRARAIIAFDDFGPHAPGVVEAVNALLADHPPARAMTYANTIVVQL